MTSSARREWYPPALLISLSVVPVLAGALRLTELADGAPIEPEDARFFAAPGPVAVHIVTASLYCLVGAFQFAPGLRRRRPGWHRAAGLLLIPCGLAAALSGLWMTVFYPQPPGDGALLSGFRLVFGAAMVGSIALGFATVRRRDIARHRAWMIRGYAIGLGAGTQVLTFAPWTLAFGEARGLSRALLMLAGWLINLAVAEHVIRRRKKRTPRTTHRATVARATA
ncbi:DUF2306 domain-containing protein [Micromonospora sp. KC723]|uniref:DUF2306 domain-containing protein n=1 Tax=Micromonospora sp. KC723 TaxID=2530381 RepID=UPI00104791D0|nr:DUF2306 domain-containing protein [Micromonospora sp. KC723]TDB73004.1 DUF2306 domain-containing protein [Micromonospora sp. KC723]